MIGFLSPLYFLVRALTHSKKSDSVMERAYDQKIRGNYGNAISLYTKAIEEGTDNWVVYFYRGECRQKAGDNEGAIADYEKAIEANKKYSGKAKQALAELKK